jgi:glycosyltransferase involved in cell wall biosynthesis
VIPSCLEYSCIIPARNPGAALRETVTHLRRLAAPKMIEIIVVDDASEPPLCDGDLGPGIHCRRCPTRRGVAGARNLGASLASGKVLLFLDAHVCFSNNIFDELRGSGVANGNGIRGCTTRLLDDPAVFKELARGCISAPSESINEYYGWQLTLDAQPKVVVNRLRPCSTPFCVPYVGACALAVSRSLFFDWGGFDEGLTGFGSLEDAELAMRCWSFGKDVQLIPAAVCYHFSDPVPTTVAAIGHPSDPRDHSHYEGSFLNSLRVLYLHFPDASFAEIWSRLNQEFQRDGLPLIDFHFPSAELKARRDWLDLQRMRDREWLLERMTNM